jgi:hypothetical protein
MITNAKYLIHNNFYCDDKIIVLNIDNTFKSKKLYVICTEKNNNLPNIDDYLIDKVIITNEENLLENNIDKYLSTICDKNTLYTIVNNVNNVKTIHKNIQLVNNKFINENIENIKIFSIIITDSNITDIIDQDYQVLNEISIFSPGQIDFNNYITYKYIGFEIYKTVQLEYVDNLPIQYQIYALLEMRNDYVTYNKLLSKTYQYICIYDKDNIYKSMLSQHIIDNNNTYLKKQLNPNIVTDMLFKEYINNSSTQTLMLKNNNTYLKNIVKIKERSQSFTNDPVEIVEDLSLDLYVSTITLDNWYDVVIENNCFGILVNVNCSKLVKLGICPTDIVINNYTNTFITKNEVIMGQKHYLEKFHTFDNGKYDHSLLMGSGIGNGNGILPIYINDIHWNIAKTYIEECVSITIAQNSFSFTQNMLYVYTQTLIKVIDNIFTAQFSYKDFHTFINLYVTIMEINDIYNISLNKHKMFIDNDYNNEIVTCYINDVLLNYLMYDTFNEKSVFFVNLYEEIVRRNIFTMKDKINKLFNKYNENFTKISAIINKLTDLKNMNNIYKLSISKEYIKEYIKEFKNNNGVISETSYSQFKILLSKRNYDYCTNVQELNSIFTNTKTILNNLLLQSYITKNNKKRLQSFKTHYKNIITSTNDDIVENNKQILRKINKIL